MPNEIWKDVVGYEGLYQVSSLGRVKSLFRWVNFKDTSRSVPGRVLSTNRNGDDYSRCTLSKGGIKKTYSVHSLVMKAFIGKCPTGEEILHLDSNKSNPELSNLRYGTHACNMAFKADEGTDQSGENNYRAVFTDIDVLRIRRLYDRGMSAIKISKLYRCGDGVISAITGNETWTHLPHTKRRGHVLGSNVGSRNPNVKLTDKKVLRIREFASVGISIKELSDTFSVGYTAIARIVKHQTWKNVGGITA